MKEYVRNAHVYISYSARASQSNLPHGYLSAKQLSLNNASFYINTVSEHRAHSQCDRGQETLLYRVYCFYRTQRADRDTSNTTTWEPCQIIIVWCLIINLFGWGHQARIVDTSYRHAKNQTTGSRGHRIRPYHRCVRFLQTYCHIYF